VGIRDMIRKCDFSSITRAGSGANDGDVASATAATSDCLDARPVLNGHAADGLRRAVECRSNPASRVLPCRSGRSNFIDAFPVPVGSLYGEVEKISEEVTRDLSCY
jgi:hypothetical protein